MDYGPVKLKYRILEKNVEVHSGEIYSQFMNSLCDMFIDFEYNSRYIIEIVYKERVIQINSPQDFFYKD